MSDSQNGWVRLYHPSGAQVTLAVIPFKDDQSARNWAADCFRCVGSYVDAGFAVDAPGLEAGEQIEEVGWVVRSDYDDGNEITPTVLLYSTNEKLEHSFLKVYLNTEADVAAFQKASGLTLQDLPSYVGQDKPKRGASRQVERYFVKARPFKVVMKNNPAYKEEDKKAADARKEVYKKPKRVFVRWSDQSGQPAQPTQNAQAPASDRTQGQQMYDEIERELVWWKAYLANDPSYAEINDHVRRLLMPMKNKEAKQAVWSQVIVPWRDTVGAEWDNEKQAFVPPKDPEAPDPNLPPF
jgi:hypothetical protein